jgi:hypothetical protein
MKKKLTLQVDEAGIDRAKRHGLAKLTGVVQGAPLLDDEAQRERWLRDKHA